MSIENEWPLKAEEHPLNQGDEYGNLGVWLPAEKYEYAALEILASGEKQKWLDQARKVRDCALIEMEVARREADGLRAENEGLITEVEKWMDQSKEFARVANALKAKMDEFRMRIDFSGGGYVAIRHEDLIIDTKE